MKLRSLKKPVMFLTDVTIIIAAYIIAVFLRFDFAVPVNYLESIFPLILVSLLFYLTLFFIFGLYTSLWPLAGLIDYLNIVIANIFAVFFLFIINFFIPERFSYSIIIIATILILFAVLGSRMFFRIYRRIFYEKYGRLLKNDFKNVLIVGAGEAAALLIKEIHCNPSMKYKIIGLVDDDQYKRNARVSGYRIMGATDDIKKIMDFHQIDEVIIAIPSATNENRRKIINKIKELKIKLKTMPGLEEIIGNKNGLKIREVNITDLLGRKEIVLENKLIADYITDKAVLITGGGGSIGSELARQIAFLKPKKLIILDNYENNIYNIQLELEKIINLDLEIVIATIRDQEKINHLFNKYKPDTVFHAAAHKHVPLMENCPEEAVKNNVFGTLNVAQAAIKYKTKKFVLVSSDKAVNPTNIMGATKRLAEMVIQNLNEEKNTEFVAVRFGNVLGSNGSVVPTFKKQISEGGPVTVTDKRITRFFMTTQEAVQLILQAGAYASGGEVYILDMGEPVKIYDLAESLIKLSGLEPNVDINIIETGLRPGEKLYEELLMADEDLAETNNKYIFITKANGLVKRDFEKGLKSLEKLVFSSKIEEENIIKEIAKLVKTYRRGL